MTDKEKTIRDFLKNISGKHVYLRTLSTNGEVDTYTDNQINELIESFLENDS